MGLARKKVVEQHGSGGASLLTRRPRRAEENSPRGLNLEKV